MSYTKVLNSSELAEGQGRCVQINGKKIALFRANGKVLAVDDTCTHDEASLAEGTVISDDGHGHCVVECPWHGAHFDLCSGKAVTFPAVSPVNVYPAREADGAVEVDA